MIQIPKGYYAIEIPDNCFRCAIRTKISCINELVCYDDTDWEVKSIELGNDSFKILFTSQNATNKLVEPIVKVAHPCNDFLGAFYNLLSQNGIKRPVAIIEKINQ